MINFMKRDEFHETRELGSVEMTANDVKSYDICLLMGRFLSWVTRLLNNPLEFFRIYDKQL